MFKSLNRGVSAPIAITIIAVLAVVIVGGVFAWQYFKTSEETKAPREEVKAPEITTPTPTPTPDETADWKIYRNDEYGFEIKYPESWSLGILNNKFNIFCDYQARDLKPCEGLESIGIGAPGPGIVIEFREISLDNFIKEYNKEGEFFGDRIIQQEKYILGGIEGVKMVATPAIGLDMTIIFATKNNKSYIISFFELADLIQYKILSTFKFTK